MSEFDPEAFGKSMAALIRGHVRRELEPLRERIEKLEAKVAKAKGKR